MTPSGTSCKAGLLQACHNKLTRLGPYEPFAILYLIGLPLLDLAGATDAMAVRPCCRDGHLAGDALAGHAGRHDPAWPAEPPLLLLLPHCRLSRRVEALATDGLLLGHLLPDASRFLEAATPGFIAEYDSRPNRIFVEYLKYPNEVSHDALDRIQDSPVCRHHHNRTDSFRPCAASAPALAQERPQKSLRFLVAWPAIVFLCLLSIRSSLDHRPANPALFALSSDSMVKLADHQLDMVCGARHLWSARREPVE